MAGKGKPGPNKGEGGRPRIEIDVQVMRRAASIGCNVDEIAALLGIGRSAFYLRLEEDPELQAAIDEAREQGRSTLRRLQWQKANAGSDTMLIWLGKQMLHQRDKLVHAGEGPDGAIVTEVRYTWSKPDASAD